MATPSRNRYNNNVTGLPRLPGSHLAGTTEPVSEIPPSSISKISDSIRKTRGPPILAMGNSRPHCGDGVPNVEQTPTRGPSKLVGRPTSQCTNVVINERSAAPYLGPTRSKPSHSAPDTSPSRPLSSRRHQNVQDTPSKARAAHHTEGCSDDAIQEKPDKVHLPTANSIVTFSTAVLSSSAKQEKSIYATLGWDNDDVDELL